MLSKGKDRARKLVNAVPVWLVAGSICLVAVAFWLYPSLIFTNAAPISPQGFAASYNDKLNLNTARLEELTVLPNVGEVRAKAIIEYRDRQGGFGSVDELQEIKGIGPKTMDDLREWVYIE